MTEDSKIKTALTCDAILIDDDPIVHALWQRAARAQNVILQTFFPSEDWILGYRIHFATYARHIPIYIDSQLGLNIQGEELAKQLFEEGFHHLYLTTGYVGMISQQNVPWVIAILGKEPPTTLTH